MYGPCLPCGKCSRPQRRLQAATKAATEVVGGYGGCHIGCKLLRRLPHKLQAATKRLSHRVQAAVKAATKVAGYCEGCHTAKKAATLLRRLQRNLTEVWKAVAEVMAEIIEGSGSEEKGPLKGPPKLGEGSSKLDKGRRRRLHLLGEYVITLYTNGKLRTRVTVTLVSGAEGASSV
ncbi:hypothetical protein Tco_0604634 [Tanacetum coccineum]